MSMIFDPMAEDRALERVRERVAAEAPSARRRHRARQVAAIAAAAATVATVSGTYFAIHASQREIERTAICYWGPSLDAPSTSAEQVDSAATTTGETVVFGPPDPIALCTAVWGSGDFHREPGQPPKPVPGPLPNLVACVLPNGVPAVFPQDDGENVCDKTGHRQVRA